MTKTNPKNIPASIRSRLFTKSKERNEEFGYVALRYAIERTLYRFSISKHKKRFVLKGATVISNWLGTIHRPTKDIDFLTYGPSSVEEMRPIILEILQQERADEGLLFVEDSLKLDVRREDEKYQGLQCMFIYELAGMRIPMKIDFGFGDIVTPGPAEISFETILDLEKPIIWAYPIQTIVAEKFEAIVDLSMANTRLKDFFDIHFLATSFKFNGAELVNAIHATFEKRQTDLPTKTPTALTMEFSEDNTKKAMWKGFLTKNAIESQVALSDICDAIEKLVMPTCVDPKETSNKCWLPGEGWV